MLLKWWQILLLAVLAVPAWAVYVHYSRQHAFRFRLSMEIEADGKVHAGSSIIEVTYTEGSINTRRWVTQHKGVTPMVDLGRHGTVMAAFNYGSTPYSQRLAAVGRPTNTSTGEGQPSLIDDLPLAVYNRPPEQLNSSFGKVDVPLQRLPALIWMPPDAHWRSAQSILPEEMPSTIDQSVSFIRMTIEPAAHASIHDRIEPAPDWLVQLRSDRKNESSAPARQFNFHPLQIESEYTR